MIDEKYIVAIVAAILANREWNTADAQGYWNYKEAGDRYEEVRKRYDELIDNATLTAIYIVRRLPEQIESYDKIAAEEEESEARKLAPKRSFEN